MLNPVLSDLLVKTFTSSNQQAETGKAATDGAFQKIFDSSLNNSQNNAQLTNETDTTARTESKSGATTSSKNSSAKDSSATKADDAKADATAVKESSAATASKESATAKADAATAVKESATAKADAATAVKESATAKADDTTTAATETPAEKIANLKKQKPDSYESLVSNLDNMTLGGLLSALGLNTADISGLKSGVDLTAPISEELKSAIKSGDSKGINDAFASLGIGSCVNGSQLSTQTEQTAVTLAATPVNATEGASTTTKNNNSSAATDGAAKDSGGASALTVSATPTSTGDSSSQTGSSGADSSLGNSGSQTGSTGVDSATSGNANNTVSDTQPAVNAADPVNVTSVYSPVSAAPAQANGSSQQTDSKPVINTQNLETDPAQASTAGVQPGKSNPAQAQSNTRAADSPRQTFERMVLDQVVDKARMIVRPGGSSSMVIKLDPPSLGRIDMRIDVKDSVVRASIIADNSDVKNAIESNIESLKKSLHMSGLKVDDISVSVGGDQGFTFKDSGAFQQTGAQNNGEGGRGSRGQAASAILSGGDDLPASRAGAYKHSGLLDVVA
jgi:flagellar hook-length control protein FliK